MNASNTINTSNTIGGLNKDVLPELKTPKILYPFMGVIVVFIIVLFVVLFKGRVPFKKPSKSQEETVGDIFIVLFFMMILLTIVITLLPNFKEIKLLFEQISNVTYIILYTIFLILFFTMVPSDKINKYAKFITPLTLLLGAFMFYKGTTQNYVEKFNVNYERIKMMIIMFCIITAVIIYYSVDPGGYIQKYGGYSLLLTILIAVFGFVYLMILLTLPDTASSSSQHTNFLDNFTGFSAYGSIGLFLFLIIITIVLYTYPGGLSNDKAMMTFGITMTLIICILWTILLGANAFPNGIKNDLVNNKLNVFKRSMLFLFGFIISALVIVWLTYNMQHMSGSGSGSSGTTSFVLNLLLVTIILGLIYKTIFVKLPVGNDKKNAFFTVLVNTLFYIPCLFSGVFDATGKFLVGEYNATTMGSVLMLLTAIGLIVGYFKAPSVFNALNTQGGRQLVNMPVYTDSIYSLGTYQQLNGTDNPEYQYGISFWVFIDAAPPSTSSAYNRYTSLLNFGGKPNVLYNASKNTLMVTINQMDLKKNTKNTLTDFDENGNRILYKNDNVLLQKWNNIIINYSGGIMDIFLNGELMKSNIGVVPYYKIDNLTIGEDNGIKGGICNVVYFSNALNSSNVYFLYNMVKHKTPPVLNENSIGIIEQHFDMDAS